MLIKLYHGLTVKLNVDGNILQFQQKMLLSGNELKDLDKFFKGGANLLYI